MEDEQHWYCVKTPPKRERIVSELLRQLDEVEVLCPLLRYRKATRRGKIWWQEALFPGYVLVKFNIKKNERLVMHSHGVRGLVKFGKNIPRVPSWFLDEMKQSWDQCSKNEILTVQPQLMIGDEVELAHGTFQGMKGTIVEVLPAVERVKVLMEFLGRDHAIDVDLFSLLLPRRPLPEN
jgi:transcriptional antiterminator RfaH